MSPQPTNKNVKRVINLAQSIFKQSRERVTTGRLNKVVESAVAANPPPPRRNRQPRILFSTQVATEPPTIVIKVNDPRLFDASWKRYLVGVLREELPFREVPMKVYFRGRDRSDEP